MIALSVVLIAVFIGWLIRAGSAPTKTPEPTGQDPSARARKILAERYAQGELLPEEYRERVGVLP